MTEPQSWQRQPDETPRAYRAFCVYRDMGADRSLSKVQEKLKKKSGYYRQLAEWSSKYHWVDRAADYDRQLSEQLETELTQDLIEARRQLIKDELLDYASQLAKWRDVRDRTLLHEQQRSGRAKKKTDDGQPTSDEVEIIFAELNIKDWFMLSRWRALISDQGRRVLGMPDRITQDQLTGKDGEPISVVALHVDDMADLFKAIQQHKERERGSGS